jgi:glycosyltransferase involved in cell wall biosynthesis
MSIKKKILFVTLARIDDINVSGIYSDLISKFVSEGYDATIICPIERRFGLNSRIINSNGVKIIQVKSLNVQKTNIFEKIVSTFLLEFIFFSAFYKNCRNESYDIGLFTTPPIFITNFIKFLNKKKLKIKYLLLKDIFPQNALDLNITRKFSLFYLYSRFIEKKLYNQFDYIGCMSKANMDYIIKHNTINKSKLEVNPNSVDVSRYPKKKNNKKKTKELKLVYGGNLGIPQNPILITKFISKIEILDNISFKIIGSGTEFKFIESYILKNNIHNTQIVRSLTKASYFEELDNSDVGLIFLNEKFTIPNYPSRLLDYLYFDLAILSNTDINTDITDFIRNANVGKCFFGVKDLDNMITEIIKIKDSSAYLESFNHNSYKSMIKYFNIDTSFELINKKIQK